MSETLKVDTFEDERDYMTSHKIYEGEYVVNTLKDNFQFEMPSSGEVLSLGGGEGIAERFLSRKLGFKNLTLVDKRYDGDSVEIENGMRVRSVERNLFEFIQDPEELKKKYGLVTCLGVEYVLSEVYPLDFLSVVNKMVVQNGYLVILPSPWRYEWSSEEKNNRDVAERGFTSLFSINPYVPLFFRKIKEVQI